MLVLTRKRSEMIQIGENIFVKVIQTGHSTVKIGIEAPSDVRVLRAELNAKDNPDKPVTTLADLLHARQSRMDMAEVELAVH
jgi:carbon storage regulator CsrA